MSDQKLQDLIRSLPEESPSLAWRSELNERLRAEASRPRRPFLSFRVLAGLGAVGAVAASLVGVALLSSPSEPVRPDVRPTVAVASSTPSPRFPATSGTSLAALVALHDEGAAIADVSGAGVDARESDLTEGEIRLAVVQGML